MPLVRTEIHGSVGTVIFDHPKRRNALSRPLVDAVVAALDEFTRQRLRAVILRAAPRASVWSAGHDVDELPAAGRDPLGWDDPVRRLVRAIENMPYPVIALVEGSVWGGACEVVFACDLVLATPAATFALTPARLGVPYDIAGMLTFLNAARLRIAKEMAFTARPIRAERAERLGLVNHVVPASEIENSCKVLAQDIAANAPQSIAVMKEQLRILSAARQMSPQDFERIQGLRRLVCDSADYQEGIAAFKEKRAPVFRGE